MKQGWESKKLVDVCTLVNGRAYKKNELLEQGKYLVLRVGNFFTNKTWYYSDLELEEKKYCNNGDLLYAWSASFGPRIWGGEKSIYHYHIWKVVPDESVVTKLFLLKLLEWDTDQIKSASGTGTTMMHVSKGSMESRVVPIPPLEEQKQIVAKLDQCFEAIDKAKANAAKNLENAKELFQSKLNDIFSQKGEGWVEKRLGDVCKTGAGGTPLKSKKEYYLNGDIPWLVSGEVKQGDIFKSKQFITKEGLNNSSAKLFPQDTVLVAMYGATAGDVGILRFESSTNQAVCGILPNDKFLPEFVSYSFQYKKDELISKATGNAQPNISQIKIKNTLIPILSMEEQKQIVKILDSLRKQTQSLESKYQQELNSLEELKKSILQKAFEGEL